MERFLFALLKATLAVIVLAILLSSSFQVKFIEAFIFTFAIMFIGIMSGAVIRYFQIKSK